MLANFYMLDCESLILLVLHTLPPAVSSKVPSTVAALNLPTSAAGILQQRPISSTDTKEQHARNKSEWIEKALKAGFLRMVLDLLVWERTLPECESNQQQIRQIVNFLEMKVRHKTGLTKQTTVGGEAGSSKVNYRSVSTPNTWKMKGPSQRGGTPPSSSAPTTMKGKSGKSHPTTNVRTESFAIEEPPYEDTKV